MPELNLLFHTYLVSVKTIKILDISNLRFYRRMIKEGLCTRVLPKNSPHRSPKSASASFSQEMRPHSEGSTRHGSPVSSVLSQRRSRFLPIRRRLFWTRVAGFSSRPTVNDASAAAH